MDDEPGPHIPLISKDLSDVDGDEELGQPNRSESSSQGGTFCARITRREYILLLVIVVQFLALCTSAVRGSIITIDREEALGLYSPAKEAVEYEVKVFTPGRSNKTKYQGLSDDVDKAWGALYNHSIIQIPRAQAALLPNRTYPIRQEPGYYMAMLDVFHQLHCLNMIRQALHRDYYTWDLHLSEEHISHCVDSIRQSLMCNADISVNVWQWDPVIKSVKGHSTQAHTCKNFERIWEWTRERRMKVMIEHDVLVDDDLPDPRILHN